MRFQAAGCSFSTFRTSGTSRTSRTPRPSGPSETSEPLRNLRTLQNLRTIRTLSNLTNPQDPQPAVRWEVAGFVLGLTVNWNSQSGRLRLPDFSIITLSARQRQRQWRTLLVASACRAGGRGSCCRRPFVSPTRKTLSIDICHLKSDSSLYLTFFTLGFIQMMPKNVLLDFFSFQMHHHCNNTFSQSHEELCSDGPRPTGSDFATQLVPSTTFLFFFLLSFLPLLLVCCAWRQRTGASPAATTPQLKLFLQFRGEKVEFTAKG